MWRQQRLGVSLREDRSHTFQTSSAGIGGKGENDREQDYQAAGASRISPCSGERPTYG